MNSAHGKPRIVVGVDQSPASLAALRWAAREAGLRAIGPVARDCLRHPPCPIVVVSWEGPGAPVPV
jgi:nucleotide-binding universal stress UspA family protein